MKYGYARVSTTDQDLTIQVDALTNAGCETIRQEKVSGTSVQGRDELNTLLEFLRDGDELVVTRVDRLARSIRDLQNIVYDLDKRGVTLSATEQPMDTKTSAGKCFLDKGALSVLFVVPEFTDVFVAIGKGVGALSVPFVIPEFTDVFSPIGKGKGALPV